MARPDPAALTDDQRATLTHLMNALPGLATWRPDARVEVLELLAEAATSLPNVPEAERFDRVLEFFRASSVALTMPPPTTTVDELVEDLARRREESA